MGLQDDKDGHNPDNPVIPAAYNEAYFTIQTLDSLLQMVAEFTKNYVTAKT